MTRDSVRAVTANATHEPQPPWLVTALMTLRPPTVRQSTLAGRAAKAATGVDPNPGALPGWANGVAVPSGPPARASW